MNFCKRQFLSLLLSLLSLLWLLGCSAEKERAPEFLRIHGSTMGTTWQLLISSKAPPLDLTQLKQEIQWELHQIEQIFSTWKSDSEVSKFNQLASTEWVEVPKEMVELAEFAQFLSESTQGSFDITLQPQLVKLGFQNLEGTPQAVPEDTSSDYSLLHFRHSPPALKKDKPQLQINFSALVEGHAIDRVSTLLKQQGLSNFLFEIGGEFFGSGRPSPNKKWKIGIQHPDPRIQEPYAEVEIEDEALSTSGTYKNFKTTSRGEVSHIIDGRTRKPVEHDVVSVSVKAKKSLLADGFSTALLTQFEQEAKIMCQKHQLSALFIRRQDFSTDGKNQDFPRIYEESTLTREAK